MESAFSKRDSLALKGIAIIFMIFHHCFCAASRFEGYTISFAPFTASEIVTFSAYFKICVSIFAFISGYGLYLSAKRIQGGTEMAKWTTSRLMKTMSGFWFIYLLSFVVTLIFAKFPIKVYCGDGYIRGAVYALIDFLGLANFFGTPTLNGSWWYMSAAILFILMVPLVMGIEKRIKRNTPPGGGICIYVYILALIVIFPRLFNIGYPGGENGYSFLPIFLCGILFARNNVFDKLKNLQLIRSKKGSEVLKFVILLALVVVSYLFCIRVARRTFWELHFAISPLIVICFCVLYIVRIPVLKQILAFLGKHSMTMFLMHTFIRATFFRDFTYSFEYFLVIPLVLFAISLAASVLLDWIKAWVRWDRLTDAISKAICNRIGRKKEPVEN